MKILAIVALLFLSANANSESQVELGIGFLSSQFSKSGVAFFQEMWGGSYGTKYSVGMGYIYKQEVTDRQGYFSKLNENIWVQAQRRFCWVEDDRVCVGAGPAYFQNTNRALGKNFNLALSVEIRPQNRVTINIRHYSNVGSGMPNMGQDMITIGYLF